MLKKLGKAANCFSKFGLILITKEELERSLASPIFRDDGHDHGRIKMECRAPPR